MKKIYNIALAVILLLSLTAGVFADIKIRQKVTMSGQTFETTKMIRGARQRTEQKGSGAMAGYMSQVATIEQCDLRRSVQLNDSKKLYFIEPFAEPSEASNEPAVQKPKAQTPTQKGGTVTFTYIVTDTGERQTLFGLPARHLKVVQETESSPDSCNGASRSKMEIDGWYVDFSAEFNCPTDVPRASGQYAKPDCRDRVVFKGSRNAKTGFLLNGTMTFYDADGKATMTQTTETLELARAPLAAALFDIPADYKLASSQQDLYAMPSMTDIVRQQQQQNGDDNPTAPANTGMKSVGINISFGADVKLNQAEISRFVQDKVRQMNFNASTGGGDYVLNVEIKKAKESAASKAGGIFGKVTGIETKAGKTDVEVIVTLFRGDAKTQITRFGINQKFDGTAADTVREALDQAIGNVLNDLEN